MRGPLRSLTLVFAGALCACGNLGTESFDPMSSSQKATQAFGVVTNNKAVQAFDAMSGAFSWTGAPPFRPESGPAGVAASPADILPAQCPGKTFVYNPQTGKYTANTDAGAPSNGCRFLIYQVDPVQKSVILPPQTVGYLDLTNESSPSPNSLGLKAVANNVTVLDYKANGTAVGSGLTYTAIGNVGDGTSRLDFDISLSYSNTSGLKTDYKLTAPTPAVGMEVVITAPGGAGGPSTVTFTVTEGQNKLEMVAKGDALSVDGTVKYNGTTLAKITGAGSAPTFTGQGGRTLSPTELDGLKTLFAFPDLMLAGFEDVFVPAFFVLGFKI